MTVGAWKLQGQKLLIGALLSACSAGSLAEPLVDERAVRARLSACAGTPFLFTVRALASEPFVNLVGDVEACVAEAVDCAGVTACLGLDVPCAGENRCEGTRAVTCAHFDNTLSAERYTDCSKDDLNPFCDVIDAGTGAFAACNAGPCAGDRCEGDVAVRCAEGVEMREACGPSKRCVSGSTGVFCAELQSCMRDHCQGDLAVICRDGAAEVAQDCSAFVARGVCRDDSGSIECRSLQQHPECSDGEPFTAGCDGDDGYACYVGARYQIACSQFGGGRCVTDEFGQSHCLSVE
jgi:hypothetical protein